MARRTATVIAATAVRQPDATINPTSVGRKIS